MDESTLGLETQVAQSTGALGEFLVVETVAGIRHRYEVIHIEVVDARRSSLLLDTEESLLSLVTCYPFDAVEPGGPMRYVVTARKLN